MLCCYVLEECGKHSSPELFGGKVLLWARVLRVCILKEVDIIH